MSNIIIPSDISLETLEKLDPYYDSTHITFNGHYYAHTRKIYLKRRGNDYALVPFPDKSTWAKIGVSKDHFIADHHYIVDTSYTFILSFISVNGSLICSLDKDSVLTTYVSKSCYFFRSLPYNIKTSLKEGGKNIFEDYTKLKMTS